MAGSNILIFDQNKGNIMGDDDYSGNSQRLNGVQSGVASSSLNNKFAYQVSLVCYAIAQMMNANGLDANDTLAVSTFVSNLSNSVLQKVIDKASTAVAQAGTDNTKWMTPALVKSFVTNWWTSVSVSATQLPTVPVNKGGTGKTSWTANRLIYPSATTTFNQLAFPSAAKMVLAQGTSGAPYWQDTIYPVLLVSGSGTFTGWNTASGRFTLPSFSIKNIKSIIVKYTLNGTVTILDNSNFDEPVIQMKYNGSSDYLNFEVDMFGGDFYNDGGQKIITFNNITFTKELLFTGLSSYCDNNFGPFAYFVLPIVPTFAYWEYYKADGGNIYTKINSNGNTTAIPVNFAFDTGGLNSGVTWNLTANVKIYGMYTTF